MAFYKPPSWKTEVKQAISQRSGIAPSQMDISIKDLFYYNKLKPIKRKEIDKQLDKYRTNDYGPR